MRRLAENQVVDAGQVLGGTAYMFVQTKNPAINVDAVASASWQKNSEGGDITYKRTAVGKYRVTLPGWGTIGKIQVTTYDAPGVSCQTNSFQAGLVSILCYDQNGNFADARFTVLAIGN